MPSREEVVILFNKADEDLRLAQLLVDRPDFSDEVFGFHLQQAIEKFLKCLLANRGRPFPFSHSLYELLDICRDTRLIVPDEVDDLCFLTPFATGLRYSSTSSDSTDPLDRHGLLASVSRLRRFTAEELRQ